MPPGGGSYHPNSSHREPSESAPQQHPTPPTHIIFDGGIGTESQEDLEELGMVAKDSEKQGSVVDILMREAHEGGEAGPPWMGQLGLTDTASRSAFLSMRHTALALAPFSAATISGVYPFCRGGGHRGVRAGIW